MTFLRRNWARILGVASLVLLGGTIVRYVLAPSPERVRADDAVVARRIVTGEDDRDPLPRGDFVGGNGVVEPRERETKLAAPVAGRVARIAVVEGQRVEAGALLVELEGAVERAALAAAEADLAAAEAEFRRVAHGNRVEDIDAADAEAAAARARAELSASILERSEAVFAAGGVTTDELDRVRRQAEADRATAEGLEARQRAAHRGSRGEEIAAARARAAAAKARRDYARAELERLSVHAPIAGEVLQLKYRVGEYVAPAQGEPLVVLGDTSELRVRMDVDERDIGRVQIGAVATIRAIAFPNHDFRARVVEIGRRMGRKNVRTDDPTERDDTKILEVVLALDASDGLVVGQRVTSLVEVGGAP